MKRILIIDESEVIRETLALILGREFIVSKRALANRPFQFADPNEEIDLLILGVAPQFGTEAVNLVRLAAQLPFAVLFLVDSRVTARIFEQQERISCLTKPFNPYELQATVGQLLARGTVRANPTTVRGTDKRKDLLRYLDYPYLSRSVASLVQRFAAARLPMLIAGEIGCGQNNVARGVHLLQEGNGLLLSINCAEISSEFLAEKALHLSQCQLLAAGVPTLLIENLDKCQPAAQSLCLRFLEEQEEKIGRLRYLTTSSGDILERLYRGEYLEGLYYKLAKLTVKLLPLRQRSEDISILADWFARGHANTLEIAAPTFTQDAIVRLRNYLWFGNLGEMDTVIARTLALHGGGMIDADDLVFDFGGHAEPSTKPLEIFQPVAPVNFAMDQPKLQVYNGVSGVNGLANGPGKSAELSVVIHELAHELKNPMVTIKTFAQLLGDRYQDTNFRARFQDIVSGDIERMDDLLEVMIEFADFAQPKRSFVALAEKLQSVAKEIHNESIKRRTRFDWKGESGASDVHADEAQLTYVLKNILLAVLSQAKLGSDIGIAIAPEGSITISYLRETARVSSITHYLSDREAQPNDGILPLRILLAKQLIERNGGRFAMDQTDPEKDILRLEFPIG